MADIIIDGTTVINKTGDAITQTFPGPNHTFTVKSVNQAISGETNSTKDNATSDQLAIYNGSTKLWGITESGFTLNPNKPCFAANWNYVDLTVNDEFLNSDGSKNGWTAYYNPQNDFDAVEGIYTAPISGSYYFAFHDNVSRSGSAAGYFDWYKNNVRVTYSRIYSYIVTGQWENFSGFLLCSLSAGDTIRLRAYNTIKLDGNDYGLFAGFLLG